MEIIIAKSAGFCFGVKRAVDLTYKLLSENKKIAILGPLIHNPQCIADLESKGAITINELKEIPNNYDIVIRSHGVSKSIYSEIEKHKLTMHDTTCPFVKKIQKIAETSQMQNKTLLIAGNSKHPEVEGIVGHTKGKAFVFSNIDELKQFFLVNNTENEYIVVAQTTFEVKKWKECTKFLKKVCTNVKIFDTICSATWTRQEETESIAKKCDLMIVIGGHNSSNTQKMHTVASKFTKSVMIETANELTQDLFSNVDIVGVTAGASTPESIIEEVLSVCAK